MKLYGRYGSYEARTPEDKKRAREQAEKRRLLQAQAEAFREQHKQCKNGCGREPAWYEGEHSLRFQGCCSEVCQAEWRKKQDLAFAAKATPGDAA